MAAWTGVCAAQWAGANATCLGTAERVGFNGLGGGGEETRVSGGAALLYAHLDLCRTCTVFSTDRTAV